MQKMLLLATVSTVALIIAGNANSADLPRKAPPMVAATAPYSWTGCYVGAHVGWGWGRHDVNTTSASVSGSPIGASGGLDSSGGLFGGQVGCNYQFAGNWVAGIQGDLAASDINGRADDPLAILVGSSGTIDVKTDYIASVTGRLGMTGFAGWNNQALYYVKGGVAWDRNRWDLHNAFNAFGNVTPSQLTETRTGWTVGGGIEWPFFTHWTAFVEGNYYDFGHGTTFTDTSASSGDTFSTGKQTIVTAKIGVNYKLFGGN
jgi:outer membrane immunogenic protein